MNQDRLNGLAIMSAERVIGRTLNYDLLIDDFADATARKRSLK